MKDQIIIVFHTQKGEIVVRMMGKDKNKKKFNRKEISIIIILIT